MTTRPIGHRWTLLVLVLAATLCVPAAAWADPTRIVVFGASGAAGGGKAHASGHYSHVGPGETWPEKLEAGLRARGWDVAVINQSVPGVTAKIGATSVNQLPPARLTIVELGTNDYWEGANSATVAGYLATIMNTLRAKGSAVIINRNWPPSEDAAYAAVIHSADAFASPGMGLSKGFRQGPLPQYDLGDGEHVNAAGNELVASRMVPVVEQFLTKQGLHPAR